MSTSPIKVVVIDDNERIRLIIKETLQIEDDIQICAEAENLQEAKDALLKCRPEVAVLDISMEGREGGLQFLQEMCRLNVPTNFIVLSAHDETHYGPKSLKSGAKAYLCKDKTVRFLAEAIRCVYLGKEFVPQDV